MPDQEARVAALEAVVECLLTRLARQSAVPEVWMADFKAELDAETENARLLPGSLGDAARRGLDVGRLVDQLLSEARDKLPIDGDATE